MAAPDVELLKSLPQDYLNEDQGKHLLRVSIAFIVVETIFVLMFFVARISNKTIKAIDALLFIPVGFGFCIVACVIGILMVKYGGAGRHIEYILLTDPNKMVYRTKLDKVLEYTYAISVMCPKLAIVHLYLRVFSDRGRIYRWGAYGTGAVIVATWITCIFLASFMCRPFAYYWNRTIPGGRCLDQTTAIRVISIPNIVTDLVLLVLPLRPLYKLHVKLPVKIGLMITFLVGSCGIIGSILRTVQFFTVDFFTDPSWLSTQTTIWTITEPGIYLIAACMPTLRPLKRIVENTSFVSLITSVINEVLSFGSWKASTKGSFASSNKMKERKEFDVELQRVITTPQEHEYNKFGSLVEHTHDVESRATSRSLNDEYRRL